MTLFAAIGLFFMTFSSFALLFEKDFDLKCDECTKSLPQTKPYKLLGHLFAIVSGLIVGHFYWS